MKIEGSVALVTGANRGLGLEFTRQLLERGASRVYAAARNPSTVALPGVVPIRLDVTNPAQIEAAARECGDVSLLINNAGIGKVGGLLSDGAEALLREHLDTNLFGMLNVSRAFADILGRNGGGALVNILSVLSWTSSTVLAAYGVSKAAAWSLTNGLRQELREQGTQVLGFHAGLIDTDLVKDFDKPKSNPVDVVGLTLDALAAGEDEVAVDDHSRAVKQGLAQGVYLAGRWAS